ncbi:MAG: DUF6048 family protein [Mariniphaga sp.]
MTRILVSILTLLLISSFPVLAQTKGDTWRYEGPRIGMDLSRFLLPTMQSAKRNGWEIQADIPYKGNLFPTFEMGMQWFDDKQSTFDYKNNGTYARLGIDMNIVKFESLKDHDFVFVGVRYGYSVFNQQTDNIGTTNYWGTITTSLPRHDMSAQWGELVFGMKGELLPNFFFGWSLRAKFPIEVTKDINMHPYIIPGIGKTGGGTPFDFSVGVYYRFPIFRSKTIPKPIKMGGAKHPGLNNENDPNNPDYGGSQSGGSQNYNRGGR